MKIQRNTRQRAKILETFKQSNGPLSPQEVLEKTRQEIPDIGIATIYRNIKSFIEKGDLRTVPVPGQADRYEMSGKNHHHHFFCRQCQRAFEMEGCPGTLDGLAPQGFKTESHEIFLYGLCRDCATG